VEKVCLAIVCGFANWFIADEKVLDKVSMLFPTAAKQSSIVIHALAV
jgi:hypothetical protein